MLLLRDRGLLARASEAYANSDAGERRSIKPLIGAESNRDIEFRGLPLVSAPPALAGCRGTQNLVARLLLGKRGATHAEILGLVIRLNGCHRNKRGSA